MAHKCPKCGGLISWSLIGREFACPQCNTSLKSNSQSILGWAGILISWVAFTIVAASPEWAAPIVFIVATGLLWVMVNGFTSIEIVNGDAT